MFGMSWFETHPILYGNGFKVMPGLIPAPNSGSFSNSIERKHSQMRQTKKYLKRKKRTKEFVKPQGFLLLL